MRDKPLTPRDFRCQTRVRVRWSEVDMQKIVFNAHYLAYVGLGMSAYWQALAMPYGSAMEQLDGEMFMKKAALEYHASARMDDVLTVGMRCVHIGNSSLRFESGIFRGEQLLVSGELLYVFGDRAQKGSQPVPEVLRRWIGDFEAGGTMGVLETGAWEGLRPLALPLRLAVFVEEQGIAPELEIDEEDAVAVHAVLRNRIGQTVATARLLPADAQGVSRIGRMAVDRALRGMHFGRQVLDALVEQARARGDRQVLLHAQRSAEGFYARAGFVVQGEPFDEVGIEHITMVKAL